MSALQEVYPTWIPVQTLTKSRKNTVCTQHYLSVLFVPYAHCVHLFYETELTGISSNTFILTSQAVPKESKIEFFFTDCSHCAGFGMEVGKGAGCSCGTRPDSLLNIPAESITTASGFMAYGCFIATVRERRRKRSSSPRC